MHRQYVRSINVSALSHEYSPLNCQEEEQCRPECFIHTRNP